LAQIDPESIPKVRNAVPIYTRVSAEGRSEADDFLKSATSPIRNAHPKSEYENIYTVTCGMNQGLWRAGTRLLPAFSGLRATRRINTVERTAENDNIHLYLHLINVNSPAIPAKNEYHILVSPIVRRGGVPDIIHFEQIRHASAANASPEKQIAVLRHPAQAKAAPVTASTIAIYGIRKIIFEDLLKIT
jgi:hypothetical protein